MQDKRDNQYTLDVKYLYEGELVNWSQMEAKQL
jgi:hypothetical protein